MTNSTAFETNAIDKDIASLIFEFFGIGV